MISQSTKIDTRLISTNNIWSAEIGITRPWLIRAFYSSLSGSAPNKAEAA